MAPSSEPTRTWRSRLTSAVRCSHSFTFKPAGDWSEFCRAGRFSKDCSPSRSCAFSIPMRADPSTEERVDEILKKINEQGRDSLTPQERRILEEASRKYQKAKTLKKLLAISC